MFQSVTYTGFDKHPERRAWVEEYVMPLARQILRADAANIALHWHDPDVTGATARQLDEIVRRDVLPEMGDAALVGQVDVDGRTDLISVFLQRPGVLLVLRSDRLPTGWTYVPIPRVRYPLDQFLVDFPINSVYRKMLGEAIRKRLEGSDQDLVPTGGNSGQVSA